MKNNLIFTLLLTLILLSSCSTDFELEAEWKDIPIVYSFLSVQDTAHYVRVEKAFLEPGGNALEIAKIPDSIYYQDITVELVNLTSGKSFIMERVDGNEEGYPKEDGLFATEPNVLYKLRAEDAGLEEGDEVRVVVNRGGIDEPAFAETRILGEIETNRFNPPERINRTRYNAPLNIAWTPDEYARIFDIRFFFNYLERLPGETEFSPKSAAWVVNRSVFAPENDGGLITYEASWESFYQALATQIPVVEGAQRVIEGMSLQVTGAGDELYQFVRVSRANTGITSAQSIPTYTNVEGGLGIVTSRYSVLRQGLVFADEALDSLQTGIYTRNLNFQ
ncbi:MAG: DUF4249 family protein [Phaeodactylibacter sp.]|nr:DUF4249 family protein [Phaeodactylibacter sp.]